MRIFIVAILLSFGLAVPAQAGHIKYTYLKIGQGQGAQVRAFKSKAECERAKRDYELFWKRMIARMKKQVGNRGTFAENVGNPRCLNTLPYGYVRPKTGH